MIPDLTARHFPHAKTRRESHELSNNGYNAGRRGQLEIGAGQEVRRLLSLNKLEEEQKKKKEKRTYTSRKGPTTAALTQYAKREPQHRLEQLCELAIAE